MKKMIIALAASAMTIPAIASAGAIEDARAANICDVTDAEYLEDGRLKVVCVPGTVTAAYAGSVATPTALGGAGLSTSAIAAVAGVALLVAVVANNDDSTTTTTAAGS